MLFEFSQYITILLFSILKYYLTYIKTKYFRTNYINMDSNILISHPEKLQETIQKMSLQWSGRFHVIADFDRTLTKAFIDGKDTWSLINRLQNWFFPPEYLQKAQEIFDTYHPIEIDPTIPLDQKKEAMQKRWRSQFDLMFSYGLTRDIIKKAMQSEITSFREWYQQFFDILHTHNVPLIILSASGLWYESIYYCLEHENMLFDNIDIISNAFDWDENGEAIAAREPIIHSFNKDETVVHNFPIYEEIKDRRNILLLGDGLGDADMANGFDYENIIKIWFLNHDTPEHRKQFQEKFDLVILHDGSMDQVNSILKKICLP